MTKNMMVNGRRGELVQGMAVNEKEPVHTSLMGKDRNKQNKEMALIKYEGLKLLDKW